jgi:hypothetical protein
MLDIQQRRAQKHLQQRFKVDFDINVALAKSRTLQYPAHRH